ncbi:MAG: oxidoreductase [Sedimenticola sp.]|mgnify:CR=1 FL=1|nr:MAG: oxidoreductase [Sedimenticola sp.]
MYNPMSLKDKQILVTGASSGIGRSCAEVMSRLGARVILVARDAGRLQETFDGLAGEGHFTEPLDLADVEAIPKWLKQLAARTGPLDGLVHSAGIQMTLPLKMVKMADYAELMRINLDAAYALAKGFRQRGVCRSPASLAFMSSVAGLVGQPGLSAYCASKAALQGLARSLAMELAREGIRVNCISPGYVETEMVGGLDKSLTPDQLQAISQSNPLGLGRPEDVAYAAAYLAAETGRWITGSNLVIDGGFTAH